MPKRKEKLDRKSVNQIRGYWMDGWKRAELAEEFDITKTQVSNIINGQSWHKRNVFFNLEGIPISKNTYSSKHWAEQQKVHDKWKDKAYVRLQNSDIPDNFSSPISVNFVFCPDDKRTRDVENFIVHGIIDGLVSYGLIEDDSYKHIPEINKRIQLDDPKCPRTRVWLQQLD